MSLAIFLITYLGIALGKVPGLVIDRVGIALLIVIEQASRMGVVISFREHARVGLPVALMLLIVLVVWGMI